jgi:exodeoxyribonuclease VII large subunit
LCDHAADLRAPTPTAAAEIAVPVLADLRYTLDAMSARTARCANRHVERGRERLTALARLLPSRDRLLGPQRQRMDEAATRADRALERRVAGARGTLDRVAGAIRPATLDRRLEAARRSLTDVGRLVESLNPDRILERGYARVTTRNGATITNASAARDAEALTLHFRHQEAVDVTVAGMVEEPTTRPHVRRTRKPDQPTLL